MNVDNTDNVRREASGNSRTEETEYLKDRINDIETNIKNRNMIDINDIKKGYQLGSKLVKMRMVICLQILTII
jgi:hypothetical protein